MKIIKKGNPKTTYICSCDLCGCQFSITATELVISNFSIRCPTCYNHIPASTGEPLIRPLSKEKSHD